MLYLTEYSFKIIHGKIFPIGILILGLIDLLKFWIAKIYKILSQDKNGGNSMSKDDIKNQKQKKAQTVYRKITQQNKPEKNKNKWGIYDIVIVLLFILILLLNKIFDI